MRRRRSLAAASIACIGFSVLVHFLLGPLATLLKFPVPATATKQLPFIITISRLVRTPAPRPTPKPIPVRPIRVTVPQRRRVTSAKVEPSSRAPRLRVRAEPNVPVAAAPQPSPAPAPPQAVAVATPAPAATPIDASDIVVDARFRDQKRPDYPDIARFGDQEGTVVILITVGPDAEIVSARIEQTSGSVAIDRAALKAAEASTYWPPEVDGQPAIMTYRVVYTFQLS